MVVATHRVTGNDRDPRAAQLRCGTSPSIIFSFRSLASLLHAPRYIDTGKAAGASLLASRPGASPSNSLVDLMEACI